MSNLWKVEKQPNGEILVEHERSGTKHLLSATGAMPSDQAGNDLQVLYSSGIVAGSKTISVNSRAARTHLDAISDLDRGTNDVLKYWQWLLNLKELSLECIEARQQQGVARIRALSRHVEILLDGFETKFAMSPQVKERTPDPKEKDGPWLAAKITGLVKCEYARVVLGESLGITVESKVPKAGLPHMDPKNRVMCLAEGEVFYQDCMRRGRVREAILGVLIQLRILSNAGHFCNVAWIENWKPCAYCREKIGVWPPEHGMCPDCAKPCGICKRIVIIPDRARDAEDGVWEHHGCAIRCDGCGLRKAKAEDKCLNCNKICFKCGEAASGATLWVNYRAEFGKPLHVECAKKIGICGTCGVPQVRKLADGKCLVCATLRGTWCIVCNDAIPAGDGVPRVDAPEDLRIYAHQECTRQCPICRYNFRKDAPNKECFRCTPWNLYR